MQAKAASASAFFLLLFNINSVICEQFPYNPSNMKDVPKVLIDEFSNHAEQLMESWRIKGVTVAVAGLDSEEEYGAWGERSEDGEKMTVDTLFNIASCSKAFTSASMGIIMSDYENGRGNTPLPPKVETFDWETKIKHLLPEDWQLQDHWASEKANVQDLLSHATGMPRHDASYQPGDSLHVVVRNLRHLRPAHELRQEYAYNNQMFMTGSYIISKYAGSYIDFASKRIFEPLGMTSTTFSPASAASSGKLTQSWTAHEQRIPFWFAESDKELNAGAGGLITNVKDLSKWLKMLLNSGINPETNETIIPESAFQRITTAHTIANGKAPSLHESIQGYGMGWRRFSYQGHDMLAHGGAIPGFSSYVAFFPNDKLGIAVLANAGDEGEPVQALLYRAAEIALGLPRIPHAEDPSAAYPERPTRPEGTNTSLPLEAYSGTYTSPGYGSFTLCDPAGSSFYCNEVLSAFNAVDSAHSLPHPPPRNIPQLFGSWPRHWSTHIRLAHFENDTFDMILPALFPEGFGKSKTPFETYELDQYAGKAEFVIHDGKVLGFGFYGTEPEMGGKKGDGISVQDGAIAWFRKI